MKKIINFDSMSSLIYDNQSNDIYKIFNTKLKKNKERFSSSNNLLEPFCNLPKLQNSNVISSITIIFSNICNMNCKYCSVHTHERNKTIYFDIDKLIQFINNNISQTSKVHLRFYGGEPLLFFKEIKYIVKTINRNNDKFVFSITTNGTLLDIEKINFFIKNKFLISISIDGPEDVHNLYRIDKNGNQTHDIVYNNIHMIQNINNEYFTKYVSFQSTVTQDYSIKKRYYYFLEQGYRDVTFNKINDDGLELLNYNKDRYNQWFFNQNINLLEIIKKFFILDDYGNIICNQYMKYFDYFRNKTNFLNRQLCGAGYKKITVIPNGNILPCHLFFTKNFKNAFNIGNIQEGINYNKVHEIYKNIFEKIDSCRKCWLFYLCSLCPFVIISSKKCFCDKISYNNKSEFYSNIIKTYAEIVCQNPKTINNFVSYFHNKKPLEFFNIE